MFRSFFMAPKWRLWAWGGTILLIVVIFSTVQLTVALNGWYGGFYDLLQKPDQPNALAKFWGFMKQFAILAFPFVVLRVFEGFFSQHYAFRWREAITFDLLPRWQGNVAHIEGASQRIQEDCMRFAKLLENLGLGFIRAVLTLISFIPILWGLSSGIGIKWLHFEGSLVWLALITAVGGTVISWFVGIKLPGLEYNNQKVEAAFRKELVYGEDNRTRITLPNMMELFTGVRSNYYRLFNHYSYFNLWANIYGQAMIIFPYLVMGPSLFNGVITLGIVSQVGNAFGKVSDSFSYLIDRWTDITELRSIHKRLSEFSKILNTSETGTASA